MRYKPNDNVIVLDTTNKPAGTGIIISHEPKSDYCKIKFKYYNSEKEEIVEIPQQRLLPPSDFVFSISNK